jgi:hypothetical protein
MRTIKSVYEKNRDKNINQIKKSILNLKTMGLNFKVDYNIENLFGRLIDNVYVIDKMKQKIIYQKHLFTIEK